MRFTSLPNDLATALGYGIIGSHPFVDVMSADETDEPCFSNWLKNKSVIQAEWDKSPVS